MANLINTLVSTIKSAGRVANNVAQIVEVGVYYTEGFTGSIKDSVGRTPEEARQSGYQHYNKVVELTKEGAAKLVDTFSIEEPKRDNK